MDWVISAGMFLTYVVFLFVFLKPGIQDRYDEGSLFELVKENIYSEANHTVWIVPFFVSIDEGSGGKEVTCKKDFDGWQDDMGIMDVNEGGDYGTLLTNYGNNKKMIIKANLIGNGFVNKFLVLDSNRETYEGGDGCSECEKVDGDCVFGTPEIKRGIYMDVVDLIKEEDYDLVKDRWRFPIGKEFSVYADEGDGYEIISGGEEVNQTDIFVREWNDLFIDKYGNKTGEVAINVRIW